MIVIKILGSRDYFATDYLYCSFQCANVYLKLKKSLNKYLIN